MRTRSLARITLASMAVLLAAAPGCGNAAAPECTLDADCDDGDACTLDACDLDMCSNVRDDTIPGCTCASIADCDDGDVCTVDACGASGCTHARSSDPSCECSSAADCLDLACAVASCEGGVCTYSPIAGCCAQDADCDDADDCTADTCDTGSCSHAPIASCGTPTLRSFTVTDAPEGIALVGVGGAPFPTPFLGLAPDAAHVLVVGSGAGVSDVNLVTGTVSELFSPFGGYGLECYRDATGDYCAVPGPTGNYRLSTGLTATESNGNTTDAVAGARDAAGLSTQLLLVQAGSVRSEPLGGGAPREIAASSFPSSTLPGDATSAAFLTPDLVIVLFENGELWTGTLVDFGTSGAPSTRIGDLGGSTASMRYLSCAARAASGALVCVAANFGESTGHVILVDAANAVTLGPTFDTGAGPVELDAIASVTAPGTTLIASAGFTDGVLRVHAFDGASVTLERSQSFSECTGPGHVRFADEDTLAVSCNGTNNLLVVPRTAIATP